jgi:threonylcarbamoyladenosine tRNA methylthiotransferase CDKAL1
MENSAKQKVFAYSSANGCLTNLMETTSIRKSLAPNSYEACDSAENADVIIVNTCGYSQDAENQSMASIEDFEKRFPNKKVVVTGCLPRINKKRIQETFKGSIVSTGELLKLNTVLDKPLVQAEVLNKEASAIDPMDLLTRLPSNRMAEKWSPILARLNRAIGLPGQNICNILESMVFDEKTFAITVSKGCLGKCNYCAIKKAKGSLASRALPDILQNVEIALKKGFTRIHLLADDVGCWGQDLGINSSHLLGAILRLPYDFKLVVNYFDPTWLVKFYSELKEPLSSPKLICMNIPLQSGNNQVLKTMDRDYRVEDVLKCLHDIRKNNPAMALKTHLMVGYPTESNKQFFDSLKTLPHFDLVFPNKYGPRPGTPAEKWKQLPEWTKSVRFHSLKFLIHILHTSVLLSSLLYRRNPSS